MTTNYRRLVIDDVNAFYREAGDPEARPRLLLHGSPCSSQMYRNLIPAVAERDYVAARDFPGFGFTEAPSHDDYAYRFNVLVQVVERFIERIKPGHYAVMAFDHGSAVGFRLPPRHPGSIACINSQNGNAYEGCGPFRAEDETQRERSRIVPFLRRVFS